MELDQRIRNRTLMQARALCLEDRHGRDVAVVVAKLAVYAAPDGSIKRSLQRPVRITDEPWFADRPSSPRFVSDFPYEKPGTDVLLVGHAHPPREDATRMEVTLRVRRDQQLLVDKTLLVHGPRVWHAGVTRVEPGPSARLGVTPLCYELAYGGSDHSQADDPVIDLRNPVGSGAARDPASLVGKPAPQIEDPAHPCGSSHPAPAGFGPLASHWTPRAELAGTFDDGWRRKRAPVLPLDFDPRHHACAPADQWLEEPLRGGEQVEVIGATEAGRWSFVLPEVAPTFTAVVRGQRVRADTWLDTVIIDADHLHLELVWRAAFVLPRKHEQLTQIDLAPRGSLPLAAYDVDMLEIRKALKLVSPHG